MPPTNVEVVRRWLDAYNRRDLEELFSLTDPDLEFRSIFVAIEPVFRGYTGIRSYFEGLADAYDHFQLIPKEFIDAGAGVVWAGHVTWRGKESGAEGAKEITVALWLRAEKVFRTETFTDRAEALHAVGLTEQEVRAASYPVSSGSNIDLVRSIYDAWERGDYRSANWAHPDIEYVIADGPDAGSWTGLAGMAEGARSIVSAWEDFRGEPEEYHEIDDERVLVLTRRNGRGKTSGLELGQLQAKGAQLFQIRENKVTRFVTYWDRDRALADVGVETDPSRS